MIRISACALGLMGCSAIIGIKDVPEPAITPEADAPIEASTKDGPIDVPIVDAGPCSTDAGSCSNMAIVPAGWTPVIFSTSVLMCPTKFSGGNVFADPVAASGACTCVVGNQVAPTCTSGSITRSNGGGCGTNAGSISVTGGCNVAGGSLESSEKITTAPPGGSCTSNAQADASKLGSTPAAVCAPLACQDDVCAGAAPQGFSACIQTSNDATCPPSFPNEHATGDTIQLDCSAACTNCVTSATCSSPLLAFYSDTGCQNGLTAIGADNVCHVTGLSTTTFGSVLYTASPSNISYVANGPKTAKIVRTTPKTICCK